MDHQDDEITMTNNDFQRTATRIVTDYLLTPGEKILEVAASPAAALITTTHRGWRVESTAAPRADLTIFAATSAVSDAGGPVRQFAMLSEDRIFRLDDPEQLREYIRQLEPALDAMSIARLVVENAEPSEQPRFLVESPVTSSPEAQRADRPGPPQIVSRESLGIQIRLFAFTWEYPDDETEVKRYERWDVFVGTAGDIRWHRVLNSETGAEDD
jgi:hypothetical protein